MSIAREGLAPARRLKGVNPFRVMTVLERAQALEQQGRSIIHLEVGEPDFSTVAPIVEAGRQALSDGRTRYTAAAGLPELRQRISQYYAEAHDVEVAPARIFITPGASGALVLLSQLLINPGDRVLMSDPGYPCNRNYVSLAGGLPGLIPVGADTDYQLSADLLSRHRCPQTRGVWLASPGNPSGSALDMEQLQSLSGWARQNGCHLLVDEIYHGLDYCGGLPSALQADDDNLVINSFSKYFGMTGWRLGWLVLPESLLEAAGILAQNLFIAASTIAQVAALRAFDADVRQLLDARRAEFQERRDYLVSALRELGFTIPRQPRGAFYIYAGIEQLADDSEHFCHQLLESHGVAVTPGTDFGSWRASTHVRFAFTTGLPDLQRAVERIRQFVGERCRAADKAPAGGEAP